MAINLKQTEVAAKYQGGIMTPRLNTGATIGETVVTGVRETGPDSGVGFRSLGMMNRKYDNPYNDGTFDPDIRGSAMMEDDAGYDEAYNYTQDMRDLENLNPAGKYRGQNIDKLLTKTKEKASEFLGEEIDKTTDITKTVANLKNPLYLGTKATTGLIKGTVGILNIFGKNLGISEGKLSADKFNATISKPNNYITGLIHGTIDRGADAAKEIIGATDSEDQG